MGLEKKKDGLLLLDFKTNAKSRDSKKKTPRDMRNKI